MFELVNNHTLFWFRFHIQSTRQRPWRVLQKQTLYEKYVINAWRLQVIPSAGTIKCGRYMGRDVISRDVIARVGCI